MTMRLAALAIGAVVVACSPQVASQATQSEALPTESVHPISGLKVIPITIGEGSSAHGFAAEVADTSESRVRGLMFRNELGPDEAMIFIFNDGQARSFWMRNTPIPLDIIFVGPDNRIVNIARESIPYSLKPVVSDGVAPVVVEIPGGRAAELGIEAGDKVAW